MKRMFKVISPMEKRDGGTWWLRCGSGFVNKDNSINIYLDALPISSKGGGVTLQLRELSEDELRESREKRASTSSYSARGTLGQNSFTPDALGSFQPPSDTGVAADAVPF